jgi:hypothetical protein
MTSKKDEVVLEILNKQLSYFDKTVDDVKDNEKWYEENSFAEKQFMWINLMWGFKVKENEI